MNRLISNIASFFVLMLFLLLSLATSSEIEIKPLNTEIERTATHLVVKNLDTFDYVNFILRVHPIDSTGNQAYYFLNGFNLKRGKSEKVLYEQFSLKKFKDKEYSYEELNPNWSSSRISLEIGLDGYDSSKQPRSIRVQLD